MSSKKTLHEICVELDVSRRTIQRYEKAGLVCATDRNKYGHLLYDRAAIEKIAKIRFYQQLGFWVKDIKGLLEAPNDVVKVELEKQLVKLEKQRTEAEALIKRAYEFIDALEK